MKLSDIVSHAGLSGYAEVALVLFLIAFVLVVVTLMMPRRAQMWEHARHLPLEDDGYIAPPRREE
jgi:uncharacterized membrane protein YtjA (UPF0391 family)